MMYRIGLEVVVPPEGFPLPTPPAHALDTDGASLCGHHEPGELFPVLSGRTWAALSDRELDERCCPECVEQAELLGGFGA